MLASGTARSICRSRYCKSLTPGFVPGNIATIVSDRQVIRTKPVPRIPPPGALDLSAQAEPLIFSTRNTQNVPNSSTSSPWTSSRAADLLHALRTDSDRLVELELGRYDSPDVFDRVQMPLGRYVDWLERSEGGKVDGRQVYLAQWRGAEEISELKRLVKPPEVLVPMIESEAVDLYQTSFFIGPAGAVTPIHHDPYANLYHLHASSAPQIHAKHFVLFPPSASSALSRTPGVQRNTSAADLLLVPHALPAPLSSLSPVWSASHASPAPPCRDATPDNHDPFAILAAPTEVLPVRAWSCVLHEGETLYIPRRWWHRVENVALPEHGGAQSRAAEWWAHGARRAGWTAGVGWWFLPRSG
ncbi:Clavaminate synthase-like protein [Obba rivulosa]|uniref:Clavaminate synthase-like protein n=1 Tax=Obba rivulosa TaxID=1052685 RepID=A0A8E2AWE3_9APHY|nr:Clavaminate synthase-like protein [Obba rivulosa]